MKILFKIILIVIFALGINELKANTLFDSLNSAYLNNSKLNAERASMRASIEEKREAVSEFLPSITISGYVSEQENTNPGDDDNFRPSEQSMTVEQKVFQGFSGVANLKKKKHGQELAKFKLKKIEQETLLAAAKAHTNLLLLGRALQFYRNQDFYYLWYLETYQILLRQFFCQNRHKPFHKFQVQKNPLLKN